MNRLIFVVFFLFFSVINLQAQINCDQNIKQAEEFYVSGDYETCVQILEKSINECGFSIKTKEIVFELLAKSYLELDNLPKAEYNVQRLLKNNPDYELKENNGQEDFDILVNKFDVHPLFTVGLRNSVIQPTFKATKVYSVLDDVDYSTSYLNGKKRVVLYYVWAEYEFIKNFSVCADLINYQLVYNRSLSKGADWNLKYEEKLYLLEVPLYLKKQFKLGKILTLYGAAGLGYLSVIKANASADISYYNEDVYTGASIPYGLSETMDVSSMRSKNTYEWLAGAGIGGKFKRLGIFIDARYTGGINSLTKADKRFNNEVLTNNYYYIDNSIKLNKYEIGISLSYTLKTLIKKVR